MDLVKNLFSFTAMFLILMGSANAQQHQVTAKHLNLSDTKTAIDGYDVVSYFKNSPTKGKSQFKVSHQGVTYLFANETNKNAFNDNPGKYLPQYGGWCAYAMGKTGEKVEVNPKTYKLIDGKLYLYYNKFFNNTLDSWNEDEKILKQKADKNWLSILK